MYFYSEQGAHPVRFAPHRGCALLYISLPLSLSLSLPLPLPLPLPPSPSFPNVNCNKCLFMHLLFAIYIFAVSLALHKFRSACPSFLKDFYSTVNIFRNHPRNPRLIVCVRTPFSNPGGRASSINSFNRNPEIYSLCYN